MMVPDGILKKTIKVAYEIKQNYLTKAAAKSACRRLADFVYDCSKETALMMLVFNAAAIVSSHMQQYKGLRKSTRENKEYLIQQEFVEGILDCFIAIAPPFAINNVLTKKIDGGEIRCRSTAEKLEKYIAPTIGAGKNDLYSTAHIKPVKEQIRNVRLNFLNAVSDTKQLKKHPKLFDYIEAQKTKLKSLLPNPNGKVPEQSLEKIATDFDLKVRKGQVSKDITAKLYNGSAYDELIGQRNGLLIMATLGYTIIAGTVIMPMLKNLISNKLYKHYLEKNNIDEEVMKRKKRYTYTNPDDGHSKIFAPFEPSNLHAKGSIEEFEKRTSAFGRNENIFTAINKGSGSLKI